MGLHALPTELQEDVLDRLSQNDLASICLSSKRLLHLARPILYRSIVLELTLENTKKRLLIEQCHRLGLLKEFYKSYCEQSTACFHEEARRQTALCSSFSHRPELQGYVRTLTLNIDQHTNGGTHLSRLLTSFSSVKTLFIVNKHGRPLEQSASGWIIRRCPQTLTSLDLSESGMTRSAILQLLSKLPHLHSLYLLARHRRTLAALRQSDKDLNTLLASRVPRATLVGLSLPPFLTSLAVTTGSLLLFTRALANLQQLSEFAIYRSKDEAETTHARQTIEILITILDACSKIKILKFGSYHAELVEEFCSHDVLSHASLSLEELALNTVAFDHSYLLDFLRTASLQRLFLGRRLTELWRFEDIFVVSGGGIEKGGGGGALPCEKETNEMERVCEERKVTLVWIEGKTRY